MNEWEWHDQGWLDRTRSDPRELIKEALRRAVDIRDLGVTNRAVMLVDVLNAACKTMGIDTENLWVI